MKSSNKTLIKKVLKPNILHKIITKMYEICTLNKSNIIYKEFTF